MPTKTRLDLEVVLPEIGDYRDACVSRLTSALQRHTGVDEAHVTEAGEVCVHYDPAVLSLREVEAYAKTTGADLGRRYGHGLLTVRGLRQARHLRQVERAARRLHGVTAASAAGSEVLRVEWDRRLTSLATVVDALNGDVTLSVAVSPEESVGAPLHSTSGTNTASEPAAGDHEHSHGALNFLGENTELYFAIGSGVFWLTGLLLGWLTDVEPVVTIALFGLAIFLGGFFTLLEAIESIRHGDFEIDFLMLVAAAGSVALGGYQEAALLLFLFSLGHSLEKFAMNRARKSIAALSELAPPTAIVVRAGTEREVGVAELALGDLIVVRPNTKIPADGVVVEGSSAVDQAPITGESVPVDKRPAGDGEAQREFQDLPAEVRAFAGTINGGGALRIRVKRLSTESTLSRLVELVNQAETQKSPTQQFTDRFERFFVPAVLVLVGLLLLAFLVLDEPFSASFYRAMAVLVAASPCALAISTPSAVLAGVARAARQGVLIKGGRPLEDFGSLNAIAFDKTGTLTEGHPRLTRVLPAAGVTEEELLRTALAVERQSDHPLGRAIVRGVEERLGKVEIPAATGLEALTARGIRAEWEGASVHIGNRRLVEEVTGAAVGSDVEAAMSELERAGNTAMIVLRDGAYLGTIAVMDTARDSARATLDQLRALGITRMVMLTGDNQRVADAIAAEIGLTDAFGDLLPEDKVSAIDRLREESGQVAMIGDGVNDAPALARSTVGVAMGAAGSDVALETADVALMGDDLSTLPFAVGLSRRARSIIRQNLWFSLGMVAFLIPATLFGFANISVAVVLHEGSTLLVVGNALRLLAYRMPGASAT